MNASDFKTCEMCGKDSADNKGYCMSCDHTTNENKIAKLTAVENKAWNKAFGFYIESMSYSNAEADRQAWKDLQIEFPRLKKYDDCK